MATKKKTAVQRVAAEKGSKAISWVKAQSDLRTTAAFLFGIIAGRQVAVFINKQTGAISGIMGIDPKHKKLIVDAGVTALGLVGSQLANNKEIKFVAYGVATGGLINVIQDVTGKNLLAGISDDFNLGATTPELPKSDVMKFLDEQLDQNMRGVTDIDWEDTELKSTEEEPKKETATISADVQELDDDVTYISGAEEVEDVELAL